MKRTIVLVAMLGVVALLGAGAGLAIHSQYPPPEGDPYPTPTYPPSDPAPVTSAAITSKTRVVVTSGPAQVITLKTRTGKKVKQMQPGIYTVLVRDRSAAHNVHIVAPGFNKKTKVAFVGTQTWKVKVARTGTLRFLCDPHAAFGMKGSAKIVS